MQTLTPPFKRIAQAHDIAFGAVACSHGSTRAAEVPGAAPSSTRRRLADLDGHLHCSIVGTCLGTGELRKLMARHLDVLDASDLDVHHDAVRMISDNGPVARSIHKALDHRHDGALRQAARLRGANALLDWLVFPVDCIDHDSVGTLKRLCGRLQVPFVPLRSTGIASFVAGLAASG